MRDVNVTVAVVLLTKWTSTLPKGPNPLRASFGVLRKEMKSALAGCTANAAQTAPTNIVYFNNFMWDCSFVCYYFILLSVFAPPEQVDCSRGTLGEVGKVAGTMPAMNTTIISFCP